MQYLKAADDALEDKNYDNALDILNDALKYYKNSPRIYLMLAEVRERLAISATDDVKRQEHIEEAFEAYNKAAELI